MAADVLGMEAEIVAEAVIHHDPIFICQLERVRE